MTAAYPQRDMNTLKCYGISQYSTTPVPPISSLQNACVLIPKIRLALRLKVPYPKPAFRISPWPAAYIYIPVEQRPAIHMTTTIRYRNRDSIWFHDFFCDATREKSPSSYNRKVLVKLWERHLRDPREWEMSPQFWIVPWERPCLMDQIVFFKHVRPEFVTLIVPWATDRKWISNMQENPPNFNKNTQNDGELHAYGQEERKDLPQLSSNGMAKMAN